MKKFRLKLSEADEDTLVSIMTGLIIAAMIIASILFND